jgi:Ser/Thr protein kinase RdoA (MazF antagonist)
VIPTSVLRDARRGFGLRRGHVRTLSTRFGKICLAHRTGDGRHTQLRLVQEQVDTATRLASEAQWLTHLHHSHHLAVPVPQPWRGSTPASPPITSDDGSVWRAAAFSWVDGRHLNAGLDASAMSRSGAFLAQLHRANRDAPSGIAELRPTWWIPRLFELATSLRDVVHGAGPLRPDLSLSLARELVQAHDALIAAHAALPVGPSVEGLIHTDAHWQNLRFTRQRVGLVDFEDFANGRFMLDLACVWDKVEGRRNARQLLDALLAGYDRVSPLPSGHLRDLQVMLAFRRFDYAGWVLSWPRQDMFAWGPRLLAGTLDYVAGKLGH